MVRSWFILALCFGIAASAEARRYVPLMPSKTVAKRASKSTSVARRAVATREARYAEKLPELGAGPDVPVTTDGGPSFVVPASPTPTPRTSEQTLGIGVEVGALSTPTNGAGGFSLQLAPGGRGYVRLPLWDRTYLKASLGYFYQSEGTFAIPVNRHVFELGGNLQYSLLHGGGFRLLGGIAARVDLALVQENDAFGLPMSSFQSSVRGGPALGVLYGIGPSTSLSFDLEGTYSTLGRIQYGAAAGVVFYWR